MEKLGKEKCKQRREKKLIKANADLKHKENGCVLCAQNNKVQLIYHQRAETQNLNPRGSNLIVYTVEDNAMTPELCEALLLKEIVQS